MERAHGRGAAALRPIEIVRRYLAFPEGSVLIRVGRTQVICNATVESGVPSFLRGSGKGWVTAEYAMLPRATQVRTPRESSRGMVAGRTMEIQRLIGRSLRSVVDLAALGERTVWIDCDVIQADGGTRTASVTGAFVALVDALETLRVRGELAGDRERLPLVDFLAAVSVGVVGDTPLLDLEYEEDAVAQVDMNVVATGRGELVEVQGTGEGRPFGRPEFLALLDLAFAGIEELVARQREALGEIALRIGAGPV